MPNGSPATRVDVLVIGGGPAGSAAAILLAEMGHEVLLVEQHRFPRHKMCGEFLSPECQPMLARLGVWEAILALEPAPLTSARLTAPGGQRLDLPLPGQAFGLSRYRLDHLLLERARAVGVTVYEGCPIGELYGSLEQGFHAMEREIRIEARVVLGAWGKRSRLDRVLERPFFSRAAPFMALKAHFRGPETGERTELHAFPGGYCGLNRVEGGAVNVCLLAANEAWARSGKDIERFWSMVQQENPALQQQLAGARKLSEDIVISNISFARKGPVERDILMLGDSAELISPLVGNGQSMALRAALLAAPLVDRFLRGQAGAATLREGYVRAWRQSFHHRLALGRTLQPLFLRPRLLAVALRAGSLFPWLARSLVRATRERPVQG